MLSLLQKYSTKNVQWLLNVALRQNGGKFIWNFTLTHAFKDSLFYDKDYLEFFCGATDILKHCFVINADLMTTFSIFIIYN